MPRAILPVLATMLMLAGGASPSPRPIPVGGAPSVTRHAPDVPR